MTRWRPSPGSSRPVTVAHCGPVLKGEFARTVEHDPMCSRGGPSPARSATTPRSTSSRPWTPPWTRSRHRVPGTGPRRRVGIHRPRRGAVGREPGASTPARSRPHGKNDQATIETREATTWCAATPSTTATTPTPSARCRAACGSRPGTRVNFLTPTRKPIGWGAGRAGRRKRLYDRPRTPPGRLLDTDAPADAQKDELIDYRNRLNPAVITRRIIELQDVLVRLAKDKTDQHPPRPDPQHPARRPQGHPGQESLPGRPRLRGQFHVRHRRSFAGTLT